MYSMRFIRNINGHPTYNSNWKFEAQTFVALQKNKIIHFCCHLDSVNAMTCASVHSKRSCLLSDVKMLKILFLTDLTRQQQLTTKTLMPLNVVKYVIIVKQRNVIQKVC